MKFEVEIEATPTEARAFLGLPDYGARYLPLLPYVYAALDRVQQRLDNGTPLPADAVIDTVPRAGKPLAAENLKIQ